MIRLLLIFKIGGLESKGGLISLKKWPRAVAATLTVLYVLNSATQCNQTTTFRVQSPASRSHMNSFNIPFAGSSCFIPHSKRRAATALWLRAPVKMPLLKSWGAESHFFFISRNMDSTCRESSGKLLSAIFYEGRRTTGPPR
jgi:hypothetical protein